MNRLPLQIIRDCRAASAAEFAMVLPLLILLLFGIIDVGRFFYELNENEKATQMGARLAVVTDPVSTGLVQASFIAGTVKSGDLIPAASLGTVTCTSTSCACTGTCPGGFSTARNAAAFTNIVTRMQRMNPLIQPANVEVLYTGSGFGYAGPADTDMDIEPQVTVRLKDMRFSPIALLNFAGWNLPAASATLTAEDSSGSVSN